MSQRAATIESLKVAFEVVKAVQAGGLEWGEGYRPLGRRASAEIIEGRMSWRFVLAGHWQPHRARHGTVPDLADAPERSTSPD